jgi:PPM family protein phosphatase
MAGESDDTVEIANLTRFADTFFVPKNSPLTLRFGGATHVGNVRKRNEDQFAIVHRRRSSEMLRTSLPANAWSFSDDDAWCLMVADGVGGAARGDVASTLALQTIFELSARATNWIMKFSDLDALEVRERVQAYVEGIQKAFRRHTELHPRTHGMGTTLTTAVVLPPHVVLVQIGDSRAYLLRDGNLGQVTRDQTLAQELLDAGAEPKTAMSFRHLLTNSLGGDHDHISAEVSHCELQAGDRMLLCSDGLSDFVDSQSLIDAMSIPDPQAACDDLIQCALATGGKDNITVVLCDARDAE